MTQGRTHDPQLTDPTLTHVLGRRWTLEQATDFIAQCFDRDTLIQTLLGFSARLMGDRMVLVLGNHRGQPYLIEGWAELDPQFRQLDTLRRVRVEIEPDAQTLDAAKRGRCLSGRPEDLGLGQLFVELKLFPPDRLLVQTVQIGTRPVLALVGEPAGETTDAAVADLERCAQALGEQLTEMVRMAKAGQLPPPEDRIPPLPAPQAPGEDTTLATETSSPFEQSPGPRKKTGATAYGLPFVDEKASGTVQLSNLGATAYGLPFADETATEDAARPIHTDLDEEKSAPAEDLADAKQDESAPGEADPGAEHDARASDPDLDSHLHDVRRTMNGGFSVSEFSQGLLEPEQPGSSQDAAQPLDDTKEKTGPNEASQPPADSAGNASPAAGSSKRTSSAPSAQILRPISLKSGRKAARRAGSSNEDPPPKEEPSAHEIATGDPAISDASNAPDERAPQQALREKFPGRLQVDRYQYTLDTLPAVGEHSPLLGELVDLGADAVEVARAFLDHTSIELRFYATFLFTELPVDAARDALVGRLFDRDHQTREVAKKIILTYLRAAQPHAERWFAHYLRPRLHDIMLAGTEDIRVEVAADLLGALRDADSVDVLISGLEKYHQRVKDSILRALRAITYQNFAPSHAEWVNWRADKLEVSGTTTQNRHDWIVAALNAESREIREMVFAEIQQFEGLKLNYHPEQPVKLRERAQQELREWLLRNASQ